MVGKITTQGDRATRANFARRMFSLDGSGITIGIVSDSFDASGVRAATEIASGDLPGLRNPDGYRKRVRVLKDTRFGTDEGRAMAQIIFDIAPQARLLFHAGASNEADFATAVRELARAGADIIVDDIGFATETFFQDGTAAQAVIEVANQGVLYFSAAGNDGNRSYESPFRSGATFGFRGSQYEAHDFASDDGVDLFQDIRLPGSRFTSLVLNWDQPLGAITTDLELFLLDRPQLPDGGSTVLARDVTLTPIAHVPIKQLEYFAQQSQTVYLVIAKRLDSIGPAPGLMKWISFANGADADVRYQYVNDSPDARGGSTVYGHPNAREAIAVGATAFNQTPGFGVRPPRLEEFSSRGGAPILFDRQGNRLPVLETRQKPEIIGPNRVATTVPRFERFAGTSAAAPHLAAIAALMLQRAGGAGKLTRTQLVAALQSTGIPVSLADGSSSGTGFVRANGAVLASSLSEIIGSSEADQLQGTGVAENMRGGAGSDRINAAGGFDAIFGDQGEDILTGGRGNDYLLGDIDNDVLLGGKGSDTLIAGKGNDTLHGGKGRNTLEGNSGRDVFTLVRHGFATILDFHKGGDRLGLSGNLKFTNLDITQHGQNTIIAIGGNELARLMGVNASSLTAIDFMKR
jgi:subtilisin family serine protease